MTGEPVGVRRSAF